MRKRTHNLDCQASAPPLDHFISIMGCCSLIAEGGSLTVHLWCLHCRVNSSYYLSIAPVHMHDPHMSLVVFSVQTSWLSGGDRLKPGAAFIWAGNPSIWLWGHRLIHLSADCPPMISYNCLHVPKRTNIFSHSSLGKISSSACCSTKNHGICP